MNPFDVFPRRNLPPESEEWGRFVEDRIYELENQEEAGSQTLQGLNRTSAASLQTLSRQLDNLALQVQAVEDLYNALPVAYQETVTQTNFGLPSSGWNTVATITFIPPREGKFVWSATASGRLVSGSTSTNMEAEYRIIATGYTSAVVPGLYASPDGTWMNNFLVTGGATSGTLDPSGSPLTISLQVDPVTSASWGSGTGSYAVLSGFATFSS